MARKNKSIEDNHLPDTPELTVETPKVSKPSIEDKILELRRLGKNNNTIAAMLQVDRVSVVDKV